MSTNNLGFGNESYSKKLGARVTVNTNQNRNIKGYKNTRPAAQIDYNIDNNEKRLLYSLQKIKEFRQNMNNAEYEARYYDQDRNKKKIEVEKDEDGNQTPEQFLQSLSQKTKDQGNIY